MISRFQAILFILAISATGFSQSSNFREDLLLKWDNTRAYSIEIAQAMPSGEYDYKPTEDVRSFQEQVIHMADNVTWLCSAFLGGTPFERESPVGKEACLDYLKRALDYAYTTLETLDLSTLDDEVDFFAGPMRRQRILFLLNDHLTHHRGQLIMYLRLKGITPAKYRGW
ncbi:MAG: DinB family protein [Saprospiraceae bacterium]|nr:DinB family protein [Saprospiraceae bacterium]